MDRKKSIHSLYKLPQDSSNLVIEAKDIYKKYRVYYDKGSSLKEKLLFRKRNLYEERWVLRGVDLQVRRGEAVGLLGVNGCGKSTFLKLLSRIMYPNKGQIKINGRVSCLIELGAGFHPDLSGRENIYTNAAIFGLTKKEIDRRLSDIIEFSELGEYIDNPVRTYSSGMYMRLAFSVAINVDADILLVDEILAVGDANFQEKCLNKLRQLKKDGMTIVIVSHDINTIKEFCDQGIWISEGVVAASGEISEVAEAYLDYLEAQKAPAEEPEPPLEEEKPEEPAPEEEEVKIDVNSDHFGYKDAIITNVELLDHNGRETKIFTQGKPFTLKIHYEIIKQGKEYIFGMAFHEKDGSLIYGVNQKLDGVPTVTSGKNGVVVFSGEHMELMAGKYILSVAITDDQDAPMDFYKNYCTFEVVSEKPGIGIVYFEHHWKQEKEKGKS